MVGSSELKTDAKAEAQQAKALNAGVKVLSDYFTNITAEDLKARGFVAQFRVRNNNADESKGFDSTSEVTWKDLDDESVHRVTFSTEFFDNDFPDAEDVLEAPKGDDPGGDRRGRRRGAGGIAGVCPAVYPAVRDRV